MKKLKLLDTFSGIGGFSYAAEKLVGGFETTQFIEIDPYCQKVLNKHWPNVPIHDDITTFTAEPFQFEAVCGGFPCTDISTAGKRLGITKETRSGLFFELMRVIRMVRPRYIILENVAAILNNGLDIVLKELSEGGYNAEWSTFRASDTVQACHHRDRWFLVAYKRTLTDPQGIGMEGMRSSREQVKLKMEKTGLSKWGYKRRLLSPNWRSYTSEPCLRRGDDGLRDRSHRLKALGNAVIPACAAIPLQRVKDIHEQLTTVDH
jgi:DNA (cytosine-5)-methyltransferase 1